MKLPGVVFFIPLALLTPCVRAQCPSSPSEPLAVGLKIVHIPGGPKTVVWYPTRTAESSYEYSKLLHGLAAVQAPPRDCQRYPLVIFSHGLDGCGTQSVFITEQLARAGYVVAAPDHRDAGCSSDGRGFVRWHLPKRSFLRPASWNEGTYLDRRRDLESVLNWMVTSPDFGRIIDGQHIAAAGHSLGGYAALALAGGWESWRDPRIKAVLMFSPWVRPFAAQERLSAIHVPLMYQGAQLDLGMTPWIRGARGIYSRSGEPKYYLELKAGTHLEWTNAVCLGHKTVASCVEKKSNARLIVDYSTAFLDRYLKNAGELDQLSGAGLHSYLKADRPH